MEVRGEIRDDKRKRGWEVRKRKCGDEERGGRGEAGQEEPLLSFPSCLSSINLAES